MSLFVEDEVETFDPLKTIYDFIQFVDRICVVALQVGELGNGFVRTLKTHHSIHI